MKNLAIFIITILAFPAISSAGDDIFSDMKKKMMYLNKRQALISKNIANADTPNYKSRDLAPMKKASKHSGIRLMTTSPGHIGQSNSRYNFKTIREKKTEDTALNGNNVVLEEQMLKMSETDIDYKTTISMMKQMSAMMKVAIGDNR